MRIIQFLGIIVLLMLSDCTQESTSPGAKEKISLKAPNGELIANSLELLKEETAKVIAIKKGIDMNFELLQIDYLPLTTGYVAIVNYQLEDGSIGNFAKTKDAQVNYMASSFFIDGKQTTKTRTEGGNASSGMTFACLPNGKCSKSDCVLQGVYDDKTGTSTLRCKCNDCILKVSVTQ